MTAKKPPPRRYPMAPLLALTGMSESAFARLVWLSGTTLKNAREHGFVESAADRYACRAGFHPMQVWPDFGKAVCRECDRLFDAVSDRHVYCSGGCRSRRNQRVKYQRNAKVRARKMAAVREYQAANRRAVLVKRRARYAAKAAAQRGEVAA